MERLTRQTIDAAVEHAGLVGTARVILWRRGVGFFDTDDTPEARRRGKPVAIVEPSGKVKKIRRNK